MTKDGIILAQQARIEQLLEAVEYCCSQVQEFITVPGISKALSTTDDLSVLRAHDEKLLADATRYRWLRDYMASPRTDLDDALVEACKEDNPKELDELIDRAEAIEKGGV